MSRRLASRPVFVAGALVLAVLGLIAGRTWAQSGTRAAPTVASDVTGSLAGAPWRIVEVAGKRAPPDARISFTATTISGSAGCNRFFAPLVAGDGPRVGTIQSTLMMCAGRMESEREVFSALRRIRTASRAGEALELRDEDGGAVFRLVR